MDLDEFTAKFVPMAIPDFRKAVIIAMLWVVRLKEGSAEGDG